MTTIDAEHDVFAAEQIIDLRDVPAFQRARISPIAKPSRPDSRLLPLIDLLADLCGLGIAIGLALGSRGSLLHALHGSVASVVSGPALYAFVPVWLLLHVTILRSAAPPGVRLGGSLVDEIPDIARGIGWGALADLCAAFVLGVATPRGLIPAACLAGIVTVPLARTMALAVRLRVIRADPDGVGTVLVGDGVAVERAAAEVVAHPESRLRLLGSLGHRPAGSVPWLGDLERLAELVVTTGIGQLIVVAGPEDGERLAEAVWGCGGTPCRVSMVAPHSELLLPGSRHDRLGRLVLIHVRSPRSHRVARSVRNVIDRAVALALLVAAAPVVFVAGALVAFSSRGGPFFAQARVGLNGRRFRMFKLRTMVADAETQRAALARVNEADGPLFKIRDDPRVTPVGRFLRRTSIDELPQLWNVVRGDMSLVGPRPPLPEEVAQYPAWYVRRLAVRPGITGLWQVSGRTELQFADAMRLDLGYIDGWSPWLDLHILLRTGWAMFGGRGAS